MPDSWTDNDKLEPLAQAVLDARAEHLFMLSEKMRAPLGIGVRKPKRRRR